MSHLYLNHLYLYHLYSHIHYFQSYPIIWMFSKSIVERQDSCPLSNTSFYLEHIPLFVFTFGVFLTIQIKLLDINHCFVSSPNIINYGNIMILVELQVCPLLPYYDLLNVKVYVLVVQHGANIRRQSIVTILPMIRHDHYLFICLLFLQHYFQTFYKIMCMNPRHSDTLYILRKSLEFFNIWALKTSMAVQKNKCSISYINHLILEPIYLPLYFRNTIMIKKLYINQRKLHKRLYESLQNKGRNIRKPLNRIFQNIFKCYHWMFVCLTFMCYFIHFLIYFLQIKMCIGYLLSSSREVYPLYQKAFHSSDNILDSNLNKYQTSKLFIFRCP